jgi:cyclic dehypoxanthinyl futalosine synthase
MTAPTEAPKKFRIAGVGYLNAAPLLVGLDADPEVELFTGAPAEIARRLMENEADVALMPVAAAAAIGDVEILDLGVASSGPVRSVVIVSRCPIEEIETLLLDASSRTSVILGRLELAARGVRPKLTAMPPREAIAAVEGKTAALIIGDPAIDLLERFPFGIDLASSWRERTGLPFTFAAWIGRKSAMTPELVARLRRAADEGLARVDALADAYAEKLGEPSERYRSYLGQAIRHRLTADDRRGLRRFLDDAAAAKLLPPLAIDRKIEGGSSSPRWPALLDRVVEGGRLSYAEALDVYRNADLFSLGMAADAVRRRKNPNDVVTYIIDRNVNYTNVCTTSCKFCAFYRPPKNAEGYVLSREVLAQKLQEVVDAGGVQILLQGGLNPDLRIEWYEDLFRWIKSTFKLGLHALSPEEIIFIAQQESLDVPTVLARLHAAGLDSVPGGGAEVLVDRVRRNIAKAKCTTDEWLGVMRAAHRMGLRSSATMMYGTTDTDEDRVAHLIKLRDLQDETGGFTAFFCWDFQYEKGTRIAPGDHGVVLYLRTQALGRIVLDNFDHVGSSWVTQGPGVGQIALRFGADDWGSVMFEENVVSSAGTTFRMNSRTIEEHVHEAGFRTARRNVRYEWLSEPG